MAYLRDLFLLFILSQRSIAHAPGQFLAIPPVNIMPPSSCQVCPSETEEILDQIRRNITDTLSELLSTSVPECGDGLWYRVAYLNMTDPSQLCPPAWREYNTSGVRACGRPVFSNGSRPATLYPTNRQYNRVCGRVIGFQVGNPDAFFQFYAVSLDQSYMDGISITHGQPRHHIWSYVASHSENSVEHPVGNCPCSLRSGSTPPSFIGNNYYCESANSDTANSDTVISHFYANDPLWDGQQCEGTCCTVTKSPPWFSVQLPTHTTDKIEVRICGDEFTDNEDSPIEILEIYVQ